MCWKAFWSWRMFLKKSFSSDDALGDADGVCAFAVNVVANARTIRPKKRFDLQFRGMSLFLSLMGRPSGNLFCATLRRPLA